MLSTLACRYRRFAYRAIRRRAFTYELNYYTLLPTYRVAVVSIARGVH